MSYFLFLKIFIYLENELYICKMSDIIVVNNWWLFVNINIEGPMINNNVGRKVDAIFYNENRAVIVDWKFSPYSVNE